MPIQTSAQRTVGAKALAGQPLAATPRYCRLYSTAVGAPTGTPSNGTPGTELPVAANMYQPILLDFGHPVDGVATASATFTLPPNTTVRAAGMHSDAAGASSYIDGRTFADPVATNGQTLPLPLSTLTIIFQIAVS